MKKIKSTAGQEHAGDYYCYVRVSTEEQDSERQKADILRYLNGGSHNIYWYSDEGLSGKIPPHNRPGLQKCINACVATGGTLVVAELDRFSRSMVDTLKFFVDVIDRYKLKFIVCNDPSISEDRTALMYKAMFAEIERQRIADRTKSGLRRIQENIAEKGFHLSREGNKITRLGYHEHMDKARKKAGDQVKANADAFTIKIFNKVYKYKMHGLSYREIAKDFNDLGVPTAKTKGQRKEGGEIEPRWYASTVRNIYMRGLQLGLLVEAKKELHKK